MPDHTKKERVKNKSSGRRDNALSRAFRKAFGFGVGKGPEKLKEAEGIFGRAAKAIEKDTETLKKGKR